MTDQSNTPSEAKPAKRQRRKRITTPHLRVEVTQDGIDAAVQSDSRTCMVAEAIKAKYPWATNVQVDFHSIRLSDPKRNIRYQYEMPRTVAQALVNFDQGVPVEPFNITLRYARRVTRSSSVARAKRAASGERPSSAGSERPSSTERMRTYRAQLRASENVIDEQGNELPPIDYSNALVERVNDPMAELGPATPVWRSGADINTATPTLVGGRPVRTGGRPVPGRPGQFNFLRRFRAREFWPGDGSGEAGLPKPTD